MNTKYKMFKGHSVFDKIKLDLLTVYDFFKKLREKKEFAPSEKDKETIKVLTIPDILWDAEGVDKLLNERIIDILNIFHSGLLKDEYHLAYFSIVVVNDKYSPNIKDYFNNLEFILLQIDNVNKSINHNKKILDKNKRINITDTNTYNLYLDSHEKYVKQLKNALTISELLILFYYGLISKTIFHYIYKYSLLDNLPIQELLNESHTKFYGERTFDGINFNPIVFKDKYDFI